MFFEGLITPGQELNNNPVEQWQASIPRERLEIEAEEGLELEFEDNDKQYLN